VPVSYAVCEHESLWTCRRNVGSMRAWIFVSAPGTIFQESARKVTP